MAFGGFLAHCSAILREVCKERGVCYNGDTSWSQALSMCYCVGASSEDISTIKWLI